jgi:hypothetical protein
MTAALALQTPDLAEFMSLPHDVRAEIELWQGKLATVTKPIQANLARIAAELGCSIQTARRKYDDWRKQGWRGLVNRARVPDNRGLDPDFVEWWKKLCLENGRKCKPAYRDKAGALADWEGIAKLIGAYKDKFLLLTDADVTAQIALLERQLNARKAWLKQPRDARAPKAITPLLS